MLEEKLIQAIETIEEIRFPTVIIVEVCGICNLRCVMCPYPSLKRKKGIMKWNTYIKIVDEIAKNNKYNNIQLWPAIMGEPLLLGDKIFEYIKYVKDKGIEVILNTNGTLLTSDIYYKLIDIKLDKIIIGLDAFSKDTYSKIRICGDYEKVKDNVLGILEIHNILKSRGIKSPEIILQFIVMNENVHEEALFKDFWLSKGAKLKIRKKLGWGDAVDTEDLDISPSSPERVPCPWLMRTMSIHWCGRVAQCDGDYEGKYSAGNINKQTIEEVWLGELKNRRNKHWENNFGFPPCDTCKDWQVGLSEWYSSDIYSSDTSKDLYKKDQDVTITHSSKDDIKDIICTWKSFIRDDTNPEKIGLIINDQRERRDRILVCKIDKNIVGFVAYNIKNGIGHMAGIAIIPQFRRKGCGTLLLKSMEQELKNSGYRDVTLEVRKDNIMATKFYKNKGYKLIDTKKGYYKDIDALIFNKKL